MYLFVAISSSTILQGRERLNGKPLYILVESRWWRPSTTSSGENLSRSSRAYDLYIRGSCSMLQSKPASIISSCSKASHFAAIGLSVLSFNYISMLYFGFQWDSYFLFWQLIMFAIFILFFFSSISGSKIWRTSTILLIYSLSKSIHSQNQLMLSYHSFELVLVMWYLNIIFAESRLHIRELLVV